MLGEGNIIFFIYVLQESIVYTVQCFAFEWALVNQPAIILADDPRVKPEDIVISVPWKGYKSRKV